MSQSKFLLKETSLLMVIYGVIAAVITLVALITPSSATTSWVTALVLLLAASVLELIFGALGFSKSDDAGRAGYFVAVGIIATVFMLIITIMNFTVWSLLGLVLPILYIIGGVTMRRRED